MPEDYFTAGGPLNGWFSTNDDGAAVCAAVADNDPLEELIDRAFKALL